MGGGKRGAARGESRLWLQKAAVDEEGRWGRRGQLQRLGQAGLRRRGGWAQGGRVSGKLPPPLHVAGGSGGGLWPRPGHLDKHLPRLLRRLKEKVLPAPGTRRGEVNTPGGPAGVRGRRLQGVDLHPMQSCACVRGNVIQTL